MTPPYPAADAQRKRLSQSRRADEGLDCPATGDVIVMTSNLGARQGAALGFGTAPPPPHADAAREFFRPEFFNRLDAVVTFDPLHPETVRDITRKELAELSRREGFRHAGPRLQWGERLVKTLAAEGFDARFGVRPLQRALEQRVVTPLARYLDGEST